MKSFIYLTLLFLTGSISFGLAQDIIMKNDKSEIKSKVEEITDTHVKYRKWDNIGGPVYNLSKSEIFMIIYANGQREIIGKTPAPAIKEPEMVRQEEKPVINPNEQQTSLNDLKNKKVNYNPFRFNIGAQSPFEMGTDGELRVIKNFLNIGVTYIYGFPKDEDILGTTFGSIYADVYLPVNRIMKNYENQDKGLFVFCHPGLSYNSTKIFNSSTYGSDTYYSDFYFTFRTGADYFFSNSFGITLSTYNFSTYYVGIALKL